MTNDGAHERDLQTSRKVSIQSRRIDGVVCINFALFCCYLLHQRIGVIAGLLLGTVGAILLCPVQSACRR